MNKKGFTLVELLAVLVVLSIVVGIAIPSINGVMKKSREKSEEAFIETIKDAMDIYLSGSEKNTLSYGTSSDANYTCAKISFNDVINSTYKPINSGSLVNPANERKCSGNISDDDFVTIYRNENYVYYYIIEKEKFGADCFEYTTDKEYISNFKEPESFEC